MAGCLECGEYITNPHEWVCDKCTEKFIKISERLGGNEDERIQTHRKKRSSSETKR
jgi:hypothetical protein